jgi:hypothetical protein
MATPKAIKAKEIVREIVCGVGDRELMDKYKLTFRGLQSLYTQLMDLKIVDPTLLEARIVPQLHATTTMIARLPRTDIYVPLPVQDLTNPMVRGLVINISERGLGVKGLDVAADQVKALVVKPDAFLRLQPFFLKAKCRWVKPADDPFEILAGFEIISIGQQEQEELRNLIQTIEYMYR